MATNTRPYFISFKGAHRMVEAPNPASAVRHVVGAAVEELRPARGAEVAAWVREGKTIEIAGTKPVVQTQARASEVDPLGWILDNAGDGTGVATILQAHWSAIESAGEMSLEHFDVIREHCVPFEDAIVLAIFSDLNDYTDQQTQDVRGQLEDKPFPISVVLGAIEAAIERPATLPA